MNYQHIDSTPYLHILMAILFLGMIVFCIIALRKPNKYAVGFIALSILAAMALTFHMDYNVRPQAQRTAEANIMKKYDVKKVLWDNEETTAGPASDGGEEIVVEANDGKQYVFGYAVNQETYEPTLSNMPIRGGDIPNKAINAETLIKDQS